jgi:hypothetical protein
MTVEGEQGGATVALTREHYERLLARSDEWVSQRHELETLRAAEVVRDLANHVDRIGVLKQELEQLRADLERLRALVAPVAEGWMAERSHVVGPTHELRDALNALAEGWTS